MERIIIIDHDTHTAFIEDISDEDLAKYNGDEEKYIKSTYPCVTNYSWDYITRIEYVPIEDKDYTTEIEPTEYC